MSFLACHLNHVHTRDLAWWRLRQAVPLSVFGVIAGAVVGVEAGLVTGVGYGLVFALVFGLRFGLAAGLVAGLGVGVLNGLAGGLRHVVELKRKDSDSARSPRGARATFRRSLLAGLVNGVLMGLTVGPGAGVLYGHVRGVRAGLLAGFAVGLIGALEYGFQDRRRQGLAAFYRSGAPRRAKPGLGKNLVRLLRGARSRLRRGLVFGLVFGPWYGLGGGLGMGLMEMLGGGIVEWSSMPADTTRAVSPSSVLHEGKIATRLLILVSALITGLVFGIEYGLIYGPQLGLKGFLLGLTTGLITAVLFGLMFGPIMLLYAQSFTFFVTRAWLAAHGRVPWDLMAFLNDAHHRGVLRQVGTVYQFRHALLQQRLATLGQTRLHGWGETAAKGVSTRL